MTETIQHDYEVSSKGTERHWPVPYARMTDATPTPTQPAELTAVTPGTEIGGTILTVDATLSLAIVDVSCGSIYYHYVRNVRTYGGGVESAWGALNVGDRVYYDSSATMPDGVKLSTSPLDNIGGANSLFGTVVLRNPTDVFPKGGATASTQSCAVMQRGAGA